MNFVSRNPATAKRLGGAGRASAVPIELEYRIWRTINSLSNNGENFNISKLQQLCYNTINESNSDKVIAVAEFAGDLVCVSYSNQNKTNLNRHK